MIDIFLSASVPLPERNPRFFKTADVYLIREAIRALIEVIMPVGRITFGGHPAITPLISLYMKNSGIDRGRFTVFQSNFFYAVAPEENADFADVRFVPAVGQDEQLSLAAMRREMIASREFDAAVFIGGMEGIDHELAIFRQTHPTATILPVPAPGAAASIIYENGIFPSKWRDDISFASLFRRHLLPHTKKFD